MILKIHLYLMSGDINIINIKLDKLKKSEKEIIAKLKEYIKYIKSIPGVNQLIYDYEHKNINEYNMNFIKKSNIIKNINDFYFIYEALYKKLNKNNLKLIQKYNALIDGDTVKNFHLKCDNIGPNLSIVKTKENLIFGGFTMKNWSGDKINKKDNLSFVFNFQNKKIHEIKHEQFAIWCGNSSSINFFCGKGLSTLVLTDNCLNHNCNNTCPLADSAFMNFTFDYELNNGKQNFSVSEFEVYEIN